MLSFTQRLSDHASDSYRAGKFVEMTDFSRNSSLDRFDRFDRTGRAGTKYVICIIYMIFIWQVNGT